jgi:hypothetical protein
MKISKEHLVVILIATIGNPLFYATIFQATGGGMLPDSALYLTFANNILSNNQLSVQGWGHVDNGIILSPLYPLLIAITNQVHTDAILNSQAISSIFLIAACYPLYNFTRRNSSNKGGIVCVAIYVWNAKIFFYGTSTLTESIFISLSIFLIDAIDRYTSAPNGRHAAIIGALCIMLVLTRQIGIFGSVTFILILAFLYRTRPTSRRVLAGNAAIFFFVAAVPAIVYSLALYTQTGKTPLTQTYRLDKYVVMTDIAPHDSSTEDYIAIYKKRRDDRRLNEDATEIYASLRYDQNLIAPKTGAPIVNYANNILSNLKLAASTLGFGIFFLFLISSAYSIVSFIAGRGGIGQAIVPLATTVYIGILSLVSNKIDRYLEVLHPLIICHIIITIYTITKILSKTKTREFIIWAAIFVFLLTLTPNLIFSHKFTRSVGEQDNPLAGCRKHITPDEPIFSLSTLEPYLLGGYYRALPNDSLERIAIYAGHTGVRWMIIRKGGAGLTELSLYNNSEWLSSTTPLPIQSSKFQAVCSDDDNVATLYRIN